MKKKLKNKRISQKTSLYIIATVFALFAIIFLSFYLIKKPRYEEISFSYENMTGDRYDVDAYMRNGKVEKTEVIITYYGKDEKEQKKAAAYYYELMKEQDKYENLELEGITLKYKSFDDQFRNKTKEEIERSYTKIYKNFKWKE